MQDRIEVFTQSSIRIKSGEGTVYIDPFQIEGEPRDADYVFFTHDHFDHFSPEDIAKVRRPDTRFILPAGMLEKARAELGEDARITAVEPGKAYEVGAVRFETAAAYNNEKDFHPKEAGWVGYVLMLGGKRIYVAGDTDKTRDNAQVRCDIALVPIGGYYTMDFREAADLINEIRPEVVIPTHYGTIVGKKEDGAAFAELVEDGIRVDLRLYQ